MVRTKCHSAWRGKLACKLKHDMRLRIPASQVKCTAITGSKTQATPPIKC